MSRTKLAEVVETAKFRELLKSGDTARRIREASHLHRSDIAAVLGVTVMAVAGYEKHRSLPSEAVAMRYLALLRELEQVPGNGSLGHSEDRDLESARRVDAAGAAVHDATRFA